MDRLQAVADVGQGARHDHAHRVIEVARPASRPRCGWLGCRPGRRSRVWLLRAVVVASVRSRGPNDRSFGHASGGRHRQAQVAAAEPVPRSRRPGRSPAHPAAGGSPRAGRGSLGVGRIELRQGVADDPRPVAVVGGSGAVSASSRRNAVVAARSTPAIDRSAQASAFWTSGSSSPIRSPTIGRAVRARPRGRGRADGRRTASWRSCCRRAAAPSATGCRRAARAPPSGTARSGSPCRPGGRGCRR